MSEKVIFNSSLYPQYEIEIDGQTYALKSINRAVFDILADLTTKALAGDIRAVGSLYDQLALLIDAPKEFINALDYRVVRAIILFVNRRIIQAELSEEEKNGSKPGENPTLQ